MKANFAFAAGILASGFLVAAQGAEPVGHNSKARIHQGEPCCNVVAIDQTKSMVTLKDLKTGTTFQVTVKNKATLKNLKVGQKVDRDL